MGIVTWWGVTAAGEGDVSKVPDEREREREI